MTNLVLLRRLNSFYTCCANNNVEVLEIAICRLDSPGRDTLDQARYERYLVKVKCLW